MAYIYLGDISVLEDNFEFFYEALHDERKNKADKINNHYEKMRSVMAGYLLARAMEDFACHFPLVSDELGYMHTDYDKPLFFSLSHSSNLAICVVAETNIGADIEVVERFSSNKYLDPDSSFSRRVYSEKEKKALLKFKDISDIARIWTRKEAYAKLCGRGIAMDLSAIDTFDESMFCSFNVCDKLEKQYVISLSGTDLRIEHMNLIS